MCHEPADTLDPDELGKNVGAIWSNTRYEEQESYGVIGKEEAVYRSYNQLPN